MSTTILKMKEITEPTGDEMIPFAANKQWGKIRLSNLITPSIKTTIGLDKVDNTPDLEKPISEATALALAQKANKTHQHQTEEIEGLSLVLTEIQNDIVELKTSVDSPTVSAITIEW